MRKALASGLIALTMFAAAPAVAHAEAPRPTAPITSPAPAPTAFWGVTNICVKYAITMADIKGGSDTEWLWNLNKHYGECMYKGTQIPKG